MPLQFELTHGDRSIFATRGDEKWLVHHRFDTERRVDQVDDESVGLLAADFINKGLDRGVLYLEDSILILPEPGVIVAADVMTGTVHKAELSKEQLLAIVQLALGGDEQKDSEALYEIAEAAIANWPSTVRPIP